MEHLHARGRAAKGFTLIEMSIVLVIIGLMIAGIVVGTQMARSARIRKTISEKEEFDIAVQSYRSMQKGLPGDVKTPQIPSATPRAGTNGHGNNDGMINNTYWDWNSGTLSHMRNQCGEALLFWADLYNARLINVAGNAAQDGDITAATCVPAAVTYKNGLADLLPRSAWGNDIFWMVARNVNNAPSVHHYMLVNVDAIQTNGGITSSNSTPIPSDAAYLIDLKIDDGNPSTGKVTGGYFGANGNTSAWYGSGNCTSGSAYNLTGAGCSLSIETRW